VGALVAELAGTTAVLCTHGDVIWNLLAGTVHEQEPADDADLPMAKGSTWVVEDRDGVASTRYLPPPGGGG
jgi:broad specificity phosphatase PhoE